MNEEKFHFEIPKENIRVERFDKTGYGKSYIRSSYSEHGQKLLSDYNRLNDKIKSTVDFELTSKIFLKVSTPEDVNIKNERGRLQNLGINILRTFRENHSIGTAYIKKNAFEELQNKLVNYIETEKNIGKSNISIIENLSIISSKDKIDSEIDTNSSANIQAAFSIFSVLNEHEKNAVQEQLINKLEKNAGNIKSRSFGNGLTILTCQIKPSIIKAIIKDFSCINEVKTNSNTIVTTSIPHVSGLPNGLSIKPPISDSTVCIFDSAVHTENNIFKTLVTKEVVALPKDCVEPFFDHGTFVASRCIFGDKIDTCISTLSLNPYCKIMSVQVFGKNSLGEVIGHDTISLMEIIEDVVMENYKKIRVYNLSLGNDISIMDGMYSEFAKLLDYLTKKYKVLFIIASGNIRKPMGAYPVDHFGHATARVNSPAESLLGLTVGSIAKYTDTFALAILNEVSPFSRIGPGADGGIKPELVAHGGNLLDTYGPSPRIGVFGISANGNGLSIDNGTSFSAPLVSQYAQILFDLYPECNPNLIRALLCHFTNNCFVPNSITSPAKHFIGFGEPIIERATRSETHNVAFIYEGKLDQQNYQFVTFHIPECLSSESNSKLKVKITLCYDPPTNVDNDAEYSKARVTALLCKPTMNGIKEISISDDATYLVPWNPYIHFEKTFARGYLTGPWELRLRLYTRGNLASTYMQDYAVIIEILDEKGVASVYDDIVKEFTSVYKRIKIKQAA